MKPENTIQVPLAELMPVILDAIAQGQTAELTVRGTSMEPFLINGRDTVCLAACGGRTLRTGDLVMFRRTDGSYAMHRICRVHPDGTFDIVGDNQLACDRQITADQVVAYVPRVIRNGKPVNCEKGAWRRTMVAYMRLRLRWPKLAYGLVRLLSYPAKALRLLKKSNGTPDS